MPCLFNIVPEALINPPCSLKLREGVVAAACDEPCRMPNEQVLCGQPCGMWEAACDGVAVHQACLYTSMFSSASGRAIPSLQVANHIVDCIAIRVIFASFHSPSPSSNFK